MRGVKLALIMTGLLLFVAVGMANAQTETPRVVSADDINAVAHDLYCPVCENVTLDACGTAACVDWRYEIRLQLESGISPQDIKADFVRRFGDRVVGTPQDPFLRGLALLTPYLLVAGGAFLLWRTFKSAWQKPGQHVLDSTTVTPTTATPIDDASLRARIEHDIER